MALILIDIGYSGQDIETYPNEYHLVRNNQFLDFLVKPENKAFLDFVKDELLFTSDAWLLENDTDEEIGWNLTIQDFERLEKTDINGFIELLVDNKIAGYWGANNYSIDEGFVFNIVEIEDITTEFMIKNVINAYHKSTEHYAALYKYFTK